MPTNSKEHIFVGYCAEFEGYCLNNPKKIVKAREVILIKNKSQFSTEHKKKYDEFSRK